MVRHFEFEFLFTGDVRSLSPERSPIAMKDIKWLTQNCTVGFLVAGQWNNRYYSNAATTITTCNRASGHDMLASGDAEGYIRLFRFVVQLISCSRIKNENHKNLLLLFCFHFDSDIHV